jgi:hypothetical protein
MASERRSRKKSDAAPLKPLKGFDYGLVNAKFDGLLFNIDRDLGRRSTAALQRYDRIGEKCLSLLRVFLLFAKNSYRAMRYLTADTPPDPTRDLKYVLVVPTVSRQLVDLLCTVVYMLDDLIPRAQAYERAGYRELREVQHLYKTNFSGEGEWKPYLKVVNKELKKMVDWMKITPAEVKNPTLIPFWKHPDHLKDEQTPSRPYLRYLNKWLYAELSAQSHLSFAGLLRVWPVLVADDVGGEDKARVESRFLPQYRGHEIGMIAVTTLAIATEIDSYFQLGNAPTADYLWIIFGEYVAEAKEIYELRYQNRQR